MECHVKLVTVAKVRAQVGGPLVGFGQQQGTGEILVHLGTQFFDYFVSLGEILAVGTFALD